jgi:hypothetical protein
MSKLIIYAYTTPSLIDTSNFTGMMKVKVGQTTFDPQIDPKISAERRINKQANASSHEPLQMIGFWVIETNDRFKSDKDLHKLLVESNFEQVVGGKGKEWFWFPTNNPDIAKSQIASKIAELSKIIVIPRKKAQSNHIQNGRVIDTYPNTKLHSESVNPSFTIIMKSGNTKIIEGTI